MKSKIKIFYLNVTLYFTENTGCIIKTNLLILCKEGNAVYSKKRKDTVTKSRLLNIKPGGTDTYQ